MPAKGFVREKAAPFTDDRRRKLGNQVIKRFTDTVATEPHLAHLGAQFYPRWREDAEFLAQHAGAGVSVAHAAAGMARLSPQTGADLNRMMAYQALHLTDKQMTHVHVAGEHAAAAASMRSRIQAVKMRGGTVSQAMVDEHDKHSAAAAHYRKLSGVQGTPLNMQSMQNVSASLRNFAGEHADPLSEANLGKVKIHDFGNAIYDHHNWASQTIDTHYHDAMHGRVDIPYDLDRGLGGVGVYRKHQEVADWAYKRSVQLGHVDPSMTPNQFMGSTWMGHIQAKVLGNPDANKARRADDTRTGNFLASANAHLFDPAHFGQRPIERVFRV